MRPIRDDSGERNGWWIGKRFVPEDGSDLTKRDVEIDALRERLATYQRAVLWCYGWLNEAIAMKRPTPERISAAIEDDKWNKVGALVGEASDEVEP